MDRSLLETTKWLVDVPSETGAEADLCEAVSDRLAGLPQQRVGDSLVVGSPGDRPLVVLAGHLDTVPRQGQGAARVEGDRLWGLGSTDMKSGLAVMIHLLEEQADNGRRHFDLVGVFYAGEEGPHAGNQLGRVLAEVPWLTGADCAVVLEPTDGELQFGCNGAINATVTFEGEAAHSARPWRGVNAITRAGEWLARMHQLPPRPHVVEGLEFMRTVTVTRAQGGVANNVVPALFTLNLNMRFTPDMPVEEAQAELEVLCREADRFEVTDIAPAGAVPAAHPVIDRLQTVSGAPRTPKQGWTDVARFTAAGVAAVNYGPGEAALAHRPDESVAVTAIAEVHDALRRLVFA